MFIISIILLQIFIFGGLALFLRHFLTRNVTSATTHLQGMIKDNTEKQEEIKKKLEDSKKEAQEIVKNAKAEAKDFIEDAHEQIEKDRDAIITAANEQSGEIIANAHKTCDAIKAELDKNINERAIVRAGELAAKVLPKDVCLAMHGQWVSQLIFEGLSELGHLRVPDEGKVVVSTAFALTEQQKIDIKEKVKEILRREVILEEQVDVKLIAGIVIKISNLVFDGSFINKVREVVSATITSEQA